MSDHNSDSSSRPVGGTEFSWCKAVPLGTGITVLSLLLSNPPNLPLLRTSLLSLQTSHPILASSLHLHPTSSLFSFLSPPSPSLLIQPSNLQSTATILQPHSPISPFHQILEHELNLNTWGHPNPPSNSDIPVLFASIYELPESKWALVLRMHTSACDRAAAVVLLRELFGLMSRGGGGEERRGRVVSALEDMIPNGKASKAFWARGVDMLGYSLNSLRLSNLEFKDVSLEKRTEMVKLRVCPEDTAKLLAGCKTRGIKLCGVLAAAGLIAAHASKHLPGHQWEKYAVVTLLDCRPLLDPPLSANDFGFYHSAIMNSHDINGEDTLWELAKRCYTSFADAKNSNKHFSDMSELNFLMCKAIENPGLTPSSSMRTAFISVFEDLVMDDSSELHQELGWRTTRAVLQSMVLAPP